MEISDECVICFEKRKQVTYECGHKVVCKKCNAYLIRAEEIPSCPLCRKPLVLRTLSDKCIVYVQFFMCFIVTLVVGLFIAVIITSSNLQKN